MLDYSEVTVVAEDRLTKLIQACYSTDVVYLGFLLSGIRRLRGGSLDVYIKYLQSGDPILF